MVNEQVYDVAADEESLVTTVSARLNCNVVVNGEESVLTAFWQASDAADWESAEQDELTASADGAFFFDIAGLDPDTEYRFRFSLTNEFRESWSDVATFSTFAVNPKFTVDAVIVGGTNATLSGVLVYCGENAATAELTLYWGTDDGGDVPSAWNLAPIEFGALGTGAFETNLTGLAYGKTYKFRFMAESELGAQSWQKECGEFTTIGAPIWGEIKAGAAAAGAVKLSAAFAAAGISAADVTLYFGETPETMEPVADWLESEEMFFAHTEFDLQAGEWYSYAFHAVCRPDEHTELHAWSVTNRAYVAELKTLLPALTSGYYNVLMHLGADFNNDYLFSNGNGATDTDQLAAFGGEANICPHVGQTYKNLHGPNNGQYNDFTWTILTNNAAMWTPQPDRNDYIKYWHIDIDVPDETNRWVRFHYRFDDDLLIWRNGERLIRVTGYDGGNEHNSYGDILTGGGGDHELHAGRNCITIKLREGSGGDHMGFRITDTNNVPFADLRYSFAGVMGTPTVPRVISLLHNEITVAADFTNISGDMFDFFAVLDTEDRGEDFAAWTDSPTRVVRTFPCVIAPPASIAFDGLTPETPYALRFFTEQNGTWETSLVLDFTTYGAASDITTLDTSEYTGTNAIAKAMLNYCGPDTLTADVYVFYWDDLNCVTNTIIKTAQIVGPVDIELTNLWYTTAYSYRFASSNDFGFVWAPETASFMTLGEPALGEPDAYMSASGVMTMTVDVLASGAGDIYAVCLWGASPDAMEPVHTWDPLDETFLSFAKSIETVGNPYYYSFEIHAYVNETTQWHISTQTNKFISTGNCYWTAGGGENTEWQNPDNWDPCVPGPAATAIFTDQERAYPVTTFAEINIAAVNIVCGNGHTVTFDLGEYPLNAANFNVGLDYTRGRFILTEGSTMNVSDTFAVGKNANWCYATFASGSRLNTQNFKVGWRFVNTDYASDNTIEIEAGAEVFATGEVCVSHAQAGSGDPHRNHLYVYGLLTANGILIGTSSDWNGASGFMTVDGGIVTNHNSTALGTWAGSDRILTLKNKARFIQTAGELSLGTRSNNEYMYVLDDSEYDLTGSVYIQRGTDHSGNYADIIVSNSTFRASGGITIGRGGADSGYHNQFLIYEDPGRTATVSFGGNFTFNTITKYNTLGVHGGWLDLGAASLATATSGIDNRLEFSRPTTRFTAANMTLRADSSLSFIIPKEGFDDAVIQLTGNADISDTTPINIDARAFYGEATLITADRGNVDTLPPANINVEIK
ncbi:MAG: hypothetical protein FWG05_03560, partial [Kiritimatiellaeota bacterium]|nr:hypothetical protein [Kiritimatiellota bacterium]